ncbi:MAG: porphobilinogen synthase [Planctomycetota bacterium]
MSTDDVRDAVNDVIANLRHRPRRLRKSATTRSLLRRHGVTADDLIVPVFVTDGASQEVSSMPGVWRRTVIEAADHLDELAKHGAKAYLAFGVVDTRLKDAEGSVALHGDNIVCQLVRETKRRGNPMIAMTDLCFCEYTDHGHCGPVLGGQVDNDATLHGLALQAVSHAEAGADWIAPSGCMDGMVAAIRAGLDAAGHKSTAILSYAVKYAGAFYGPFRDAADSTPGHGDRKSYQMDPARGVDEAVAEALEDVAQGADLVMVKPGGPYLDVIAAVRASVDVPVVAYQTSAEYAMHKAGGAAGWVDETGVRDESLLALKRAGADLIITYHADTLLTPRSSA